MSYRIVPNSRALPNKGALYGLRKAKTDENEQNCPKILNNCPIFNPKPLLESSEPQHFCHLIRYDLACAPCATIRDNTVSQNSWSPDYKNMFFRVCNSAAHMFKV